MGQDGEGKDMTYVETLREVECSLYHTIKEHTFQDCVGGII